MVPSIRYPKSSPGWLCLADVTPGGISATVVTPSRPVPGISRRWSSVNLAAGGWALLTPIIARTAAPEINRLRVVFMDTTVRDECPSQFDPDGTVFRPAAIPWLHGTGAGCRVDRRVDGRARARGDPGGAGRRPRASRRRAGIHRQRRAPDRQLPPPQTDGRVTDRRREARQAQLLSFGE